MKSKIISTDKSLSVAPEVMFGQLPVVIYEQNVRSEGCGNIEHMHSEVQLSIVTEGSVKFCIAGEEVALQKGDVLFVNGSRLHKAMPDFAGNCKYYCIKINPTAVSGGNDCIYERYVQPIVRHSAADFAKIERSEFPELPGMVEELASIYEHCEDAREIRINILIQQIWIVLYKAMGEKNNESHSTSYSEKKRMDMLCNYIHNNYADKITLDDIANSAHISKGECCRIFKRLYNATPFQYLVYYRLNKSIELLTKTDYSISEIAQQVGFCSSSYYTKCFRKEYNCVPHKYRQESHKFSNPMD